MNARSIMLLCALFAPTLAFAQQPVSVSALENRFWQTLKQNASNHWHRTSATISASVAAVSIQVRQPDQRNSSSIM